MKNQKIIEVLRARIECLIKEAEEISTATISVERLSKFAEATGITFAIETIIHDREADLDKIVEKGRGLRENNL